MEINPLNLPTPKLIDLNEESDLTTLVKEVMGAYDVGPNDQATINTIAAATHSFLGLSGVLDEKGGINQERLRNLKCLDLACGNGSEASMFDPHMAAALGSHRRKMEPWLCRVLHEAGVDITGVDLYYPRYEGKNPQREGWKFIQMDLSNPATMQKHFRDRTYDVVNTSNFAMSEIVHKVQRSAILNSPQMFELSQRDPRRYLRMIKDFLSEIRRVLKVGAKAFINHVKLERAELKELEKVLR